MTDPVKPPLNLGRVILVFSLLPLVLGLERWASYGARSILPMHLASLGVASYRSFALIQAALGAVTVLVGGALSIATGPAITLGAGAVLAIAGYAVLAAVPGLSGLWTGIVVLALARGLFEPSAFALAAVELGEPRSHLRSLACVSLYAVSNVSALISSSATGAVAARAGVRAAFVSSAVLAAVGSFFVFVFVLAWFLLRPKSTATPPSTGGLTPSKVATGAGILIVALAPYHVALSLQSSVVGNLAYATSSAVATTRLFILNPLGVLCTSVVAAIVLIILHVKAVRSASVIAIGVGLCLTALAFVPMLLAKTSFAALGATELGVGVAEVLVGPIALSRVAGDLPPRFVAAAVALYQAVAAVAGLLPTLALREFPDAGLSLVAVLALVVFVVGVGLAVAARPLGRALYRPEPMLP